MESKKWAFTRTVRRGLLTEIGSYFLGFSSEYVPGMQSTVVDKS